MSERVTIRVKPGRDGDVWVQASCRTCCASFASIASPDALDAALVRLRGLLRAAGCGHIVEVTA